MNDRIVVITPEPTPAERRAIEIALTEVGEERQPEPAPAPWRCFQDERELASASGAPAGGDGGTSQYREYWRGATSISSASATPPSAATHPESTSWLDAGDMDE